MLGFLDPEGDLLAGLDSYRCDEQITIPPSLNQDDRWLAASSLQKSIRQGLYREALYAAHILKSFSPSHLWNRMAVIVLEDIGLANVNLAAQVLWVSGKTQWRYKHRGDDFILSHLIHQMCGSTKSRQLDDVLYAYEYYPLYKRQRLEDYEGLDQDQLCELFHDGGLDVVERSLICRYICGTRYRSEALNLKKGDPSIILKLAHEVNAPPFVFDLLRLSKSQEYLTCLLPCFMDHDKSQNYEIVETKPQHRMIGLYPDYVYDKHTRVGKRAFALFLKYNPQITAFIKDKASKANALSCVGWADFILNGRVLDKRLVYEGTERIRDMAAQSWLYSAGMPLEAQSEFIKLMKDHEQELYKAKRDVR